MNNRVSGRRMSALALLVCCITQPSVAEEEQSNSSTDTIEHIRVLGQQGLDQSQVTRTISNPMSPDARDDINRFAGLSTNENGPISAIIQQRGMFGDRVHVSHDGANIYGAGPNAMDSPLSHVVTAAKPVVTVYRGIAPVSSGYETIGGAVKFEEQDWHLTEDTYYQGSATLGYTDNGEQRHIAFLNEVQSSGWGLRVAGQHQAGDDYDDGRGLTVNNTEYERRLANIAGMIQTDDMQYTLSVGHNNTNTSGTPALAMDIEYIDATWYRLGLTTPVSDGVMSAMVFGNHNRHDMSNFVLRDRMPAMQRRNNVSSDVLGFALDWKQNWQRNDVEYWMTAGAKIIDREQTSVINNPANDMFFINNFTDVERNVLTAFSEFTASFSSGYSAVLGIRPTRIVSDAGDVGSNMVMMNPNVANLVEAFNNSERNQRHDWIDLYVKLGSQLSEDSSISFSLARKGKAPSYHELYTWFPLGISAGLADGRNYIGDVYLSNELALQAEFAFDYSTEQFTFSPRVFWYDIEDYITGRPSTSMPANMIAMMMGASEPLMWTNTDARLYGTDIAAEYRVSDSLSLGMTYEYVKGTDRGLNQPLYRIAPQRLEMRFDYHADLYAGFAEWVLVSKQDDIAINQNESETAGYGVLNAGGKVMWGDNVEVSLSVKNLLDKTYVTHLGGINRVANANVGVGERLFEPGRSVSLMLQVNW